MAYNNTYVALDKITVSSAVPSITFTGISGAYTDLIVVVKALGQIGLALNYNGDTTSGLYSDTGMYGSTSAGSAKDANQNKIFIDYSGSASTGNIITNIFSVMNYANTTTFKTCLVRNNNAEREVSAIVGMWRNTAAITSLTVSTSNANNFLTGSTFSLYGVLASGSNPTAKATGGTISYTADGYTVHTFTSSGTFTPSAAISDAEYLVIAGGGAGGVNQGAGAGAGGYRSSVVGELSGANSTAESRVNFANATAYTITVGAGGTGGYNSTPQAGANGTASSIAGSGLTTISTVGGGGGGATSGYSGGNGGSGGGKGGGPSAGTGTANQGFAGGVYAGGGAGGTQAGQEGGVGLYSSITGVQTGRAGGSGYPGVTTWGAGRQGISQTVMNGVANTGSGGAPWDGVYNSGSGGSGVVIIRYPSA